MGEAVSDIPAVLRLRCAVCEYEMPGDATVEAFALHCQVEHDTDKVNLNLAVVCTCGASMQLRNTRETADGFADRFECAHDGNRTTVRRGKAAP